jgi:Cu(I)/Ag(I) efflux system membrane fusion protein
VTIGKVVPGLAPRMTARVEIRTDVLDDVLTVPVRSVVYYDRKDHVAVKKADGGFDWREVSLGLSHGNMVEVKGGLKGGEAVAVDPAPLLSERQKLKISISQPRPAP